MKECSESSQDIDSSADVAKSLAYSKPAGFWIRFLAYFIDGLVFIPIIVLVLINYIYFKYIILMILLTIPIFIYKPFMESFFGATLGKMACKIQVIDHNGYKLDLIHAYVRFIPFILPSIIGLIDVIILFSSQEFQYASTLAEIAQLRRSGALPSLKPVQNIAGLFLVIDCVAIVFSKKKRALHDMMARSFCIYKRRGELNTTTHNQMLQQT